MPFNGSGTFVLAQPAFVTLTPISSSAMNSDLSDIASGLSSVVTTDGQSSITAPIKFANGSLGAPAISFVSDTNTGIYRAGSDLLAIGAGAVLAATFSPTSTVITGTLQTAGQMIGGDGTVLLPQYSWGSDPDSGMYRIGANNIGVAVNATKILDIGVNGLNVVGTVSANGAVLAGIAANSMTVNCTVVESHTANAATFAVKTLAGVDPSVSDPVYFIFRDVTAATGDYVVLSATAALSFTVSSGSTMGFTSGVPGRLWIVMFNDAGTLRMGAINCVTGANIYPLGRFPITTSTAEGGVGGADSAQVFYTGTAVTSKAYIPIAYASYETALATAGNWAASPGRLQLYGPNVPLPATRIQTQWTATGTLATGSTALPPDNTIPQITEGDQFMSLAVTPTSTTNILTVKAQGIFASSATSRFGAALFQSGVSNALGASLITPVSNVAFTMGLQTQMLAATVSAITFSVRAGDGTGNQTTFNGDSASAFFGGVMNSFMQIEELMA